MKIAVYCSSREDLGPDVTGAAEMVGSAIGRCGATLVYGGVNAGLMHTVAGAASRAGARVLGVVPEIFRHRADPVCDEVVFTSDLNERKGVMISQSDVFIVLPGGLGAGLAAAGGRERSDGSSRTGAPPRRFRPAGTAAVRPHRADRRDGCL